MKNRGFKNGFFLVFGEASYINCTGLVVGGGWYKEDIQISVNF